jgi:alpha-glucoside transport system substrate-binding protein
MLHGRTSPLLWILLTLIAAAALAFAACDDDEDGGDGVTPTEGETPAPSALGDVDVLGIWGGAELESFQALVAPWEADAGGEMDFIGTRDITAQLTLNVEGGTPPDVALPAEVGLFQQFARDGELIPLSECSGLEDTITANYPQGFLDLGTVDGTLYGFFMKADTKGTVWYNPSFFDTNGYAPLTSDSSFADLVALSDQILADGVVPPWSIGVESGEASGWPGTDWIQQILLNEAGGDVYDGVIDGSVPFTDPDVKAAWESFGEIALPEANTSQGGATGINATGFIDGTLPPFESPPEAALTYLGGFASGFITDAFPDAVPETDFDFFPFPGGGVTGGATIVYAFNSDEATCSFLSHLASAEAQQVWVDRGGFTSVNTQVGLDAYPDAVSRAQAEQLTQAELFRFDLDDAIGGALQQAFFTGVTEYLADPGSLDAILAGIEAARETEEE